MADDIVNTTLSVVTSLAGDVSGTAITAVAGGDGIIGLGLVVLSVFLTLIVAWGLLRVYLVAFGAMARRDGKPMKNTGTVNEQAKNEGSGQVIAGEGFFLVRLDLVAYALWDASIGFATGLFTGLADALASLLNDWPFILALIILAALSLVWNAGHDVILPVIFTTIQCTIRPYIDKLIFPILNIVRVFFAFGWPWVNAFYDVLGALTWGQLYTTYNCTPQQLFIDFAQSLLSALQTLAFSLSDFLISGLLNNGRWDMLPGLLEIAQTINSTRVVADCYCLDAQPFWDFFYGTLTSISLYTTIDCGVNTAIRAVQLPIDLIINLEVPYVTNFTDELICTGYAGGGWVQDIVLYTIEMIQGFYELINGLITGSMIAEDREILFTRAALLHTVATSELVVPRALQEMAATPGAVPLRGMALVMYGAIDNAIRVHQGYSHKPFQFSAYLGDERPELSTTTFNWEPPSGPFDIVLTIAIDALLRLANTDWTHIVIGPAAVLVSIANLTINIILHPVDAFTDASGIRFFQYGRAGDFTRDALNSVAEILVIFDVALPCTFSKPLQALGSLPQTLAEFITVGIWSWGFPPWQPGVPPPFNCSVINCTTPPPGGWSFLDFWAYYYAWNGSQLRQNFYLLLEGGECTAFLLGCNTTAENNPAQNVTSNCTDAPVACTARSLNRVAVQLLNLTAAFLLYIPDLVRFNATYKTFADLPLAETQVVIEGFLLCLGLMLDELDWDGDRCMTGTPPPPRPTNPNVTLPNQTDLDLIGIPPRTEWYCDLDSSAYYWDHRQVILFNASNVFNLIESFLPCLINESRMCSMAASTSMQIVGSAPEFEETLIFAPPWVTAAGLSPLVVVYNATTGTVLDPDPFYNSSTLLGTYNVTSYTTEDCTYPTLPIPPTLGPDYACLATGDSVFVSPLSTTFTSYYANYAYADDDLVNPLPCVATPDPRLYCDAGTGFTMFMADVGPRQVYYQLSVPSFPIMDIPLNCTGNGTMSDLFGASNDHVVCRYNSVAYLPFGLSSFTWQSNISNVWPVYYYPNRMTSTTFLRIPCLNEPPPDYNCNHGTMFTGANQIVANDFVPTPVPTPTPTPTPTPSPTPAPPPPIPVFISMSCIPNPLVVAPTCTRIIVEYDIGGNVTVELEGGEVRVYTNGVWEAVPCAYPYGVVINSGVSGNNGNEEEEEEFSMDTVAKAQIAAAQAESDALPLRGAAAAGTNLRSRMRAVRAVVQHNYERRDAGMHTPLISSEELQRIYRNQSRLRADYAKTAPEQLPRLGRIVAIFESAIDTGNDTLIHTAAVYRKESLICCLSQVVTSGGQFIVAFVFSILYQFQSVLTIFADPSYPPQLTNFSEARDALRFALCRLGCAIANVIPFGIDCPNVASGSVARCGNISQCGTNFLCDLFDIPVLIADFIVSTLTLINALILTPGNLTADDKAILGPDCDYNSADQCIVSFLIYIVTHVVHTFTMVARTLAAVGDCIICAIVRGVAPTTPCVSVLFSVIGPLADLVDGVANTVITSVLNFIVGLVEFFVYFFSGKFNQAWSTLVSKVLGSILQFFRNLGALIIQFARQLPVIGPIIGVLIDVIKFACGALNDVLSVVGVGDIGCDSINKKKRAGIPMTGWLKPFENVSAVWAPGREASAACGGRMFLLNRTDLTQVDMEDPAFVNEVTYCCLAHLWVGSAATPEATTQSNECDMLMPALYLRGDTWNGLDAITQSRAQPCLEARLQAEKVRAANDYAGTWVPHTLFYKTDQLNHWIQMGDDLLVAFQAYFQYDADQSTEAPTLVSTAYQDAWAQEGYPVEHLQQLALQAATVGDVIVAMDMPNSSYSLDAYGARIAAAATEISQGTLSRRRQVPTSVAGITIGLGSQGKTYRADRIAGLASTVWRPLMDGSIFTGVSTAIMDHYEKRHDTISTSVPLSRTVLPRLLAANDTRLLRQVLNGMVNTVFEDIPAVLASLARAPMRYADELKRHYVDDAPDGNGLHFPYYLYLAVRGGFKLAADLVDQSVGRASRWIMANETRDLLAQEMMKGHLRDPILFTSHVWRNGSLLGNLTSQLTGMVSRLILPVSRTASHWSRASEVMQSQQQRGGRSTSSVSSAAVRRMRINRLLTRTALLTSMGLAGVKTMEYVHARDHAVPQWIRIAQTNNVTDMTCLFLVIDPNNGSVTYPLCDTCLGLDQIFGRFERGVYNALHFYGAETPTCAGCVLGGYPSLNYSFDNYVAFRDYTLDDTATVVVGYSPDGLLPVGWPWQDFPWIAWFDDPAPKNGTSDLWPLIEATWNFIKEAIDATNSGAPILPFKRATSRDGDDGQHLAKTPFAIMKERMEILKRMTPKDWGPIAGPMVQLNTLLGLVALRGLNATGRANLTPGISAASQLVQAMDAQVHASATIDPGPFTSWSELLTAWLDFILSIFLCPWNMLAFNGKRYSLGTTLVYGIFVIFILSAIVAAVTRGSMIAAFISGTVLLIFALLSWVVVTYEYGYLCSPALPLGIADDGSYLLFFSLLPKCSIFMGVTNAPYYDNDNCYSCSRWQDGQFPVPNYWLPFSQGGHYGFQDLRYNLAFILRAGFPSVYTALRPGGSIYRMAPSVLSSSFIQTPLAAYQFFDPVTVTPTQYRNFWQGALWVTLFSNFFIAAAFLYIFFRLGYPLVLQTLAFLFAIFTLLLPLLLFELAGFYVMASFDVAEQAASATAATTSSASAMGMRMLGNTKRQQQRRLILEEEDEVDEEEMYIVLDD